MAGGYLGVQVGGMDPYLPTWLALHGVPLAAAATQLLAGGIGLARGSWRGGVLLLGALPAAAWLLPGLDALVRGDALAAPGSAEDLAGLAPWLVIGTLALAGPRRRRTDLGPRSLLALGLGVYGPPALLASIALIASGRLEADSPRAAVLGAGLLGLLALRALDHGRFAAQSLVSVALGLGPDAAVLYVGALTASLAALTWGLLSVWGLTNPVVARL